jgi:hypothetical protein
MDTEADSNNDENRSEVHTTRMVIAPTLQTVATTTPPGDSMGSGTVSALQSATKTCTDITCLDGISTTNEMVNVPPEVPGSIRGQLSPHHRSECVTDKGEGMLISSFYMDTLLTVWN